MIDLLRRLGALVSSAPTTAIAALLLGTAMADARAQSLTGAIVDPGGVGIPGVTVTLDGTGGTQLTGAGGVFAFPTLQNRTYLMTVLPPTSQWAPRQLSVPVNLATNVGNVVVANGAQLTCTVVDSSGLPIPGANLDAIAADGTVLFTPTDGADVAGAIAVTLPLGPVRIEVNPPAGPNRLPFVTELDLTGPVALGAVTLPSTFTVSGSVVSTTLLPVSGVEVTPFDNRTELEVPQLTTAVTNGLGQFSLSLPIGVYRLEFDPPTTSTYAARQRYGVFVLGPTALGLTRLETAIVLTGTVQGPTGPVVNADIDIETADGHKVFTLHDNTDATGTYRVQVVPGSYRVRVDPLPLAGLVGTRTAAQTFATSTTLPPIAVQAGVALQLALSGPLGPEAEADLDFTDPNTGEAVVLVGDKADAAGVINATVPIGLFDVAIDPPQGSVTAPLRVQVPIPGPITAPLALGLKTVALDLTNNYGILTVPQGGTLFVDARFRNLTAAVAPIQLELVLRYPSSTELPIAAVPLDLPAGFDVTLGGLQLSMPPVPVTEFGRELRFAVRARHRGTNALLDEAYVEFVVQ
ncbi:MAG: hypothetical protein AB7O97_08050 [Planctomycetota bacterium]